MRDKVISIVDADPELGELLDEREYEGARREALARVSRLSPGVWDATAALERDAHHRGFLIVDGLMAREVDVLGRRCCELLGHGDVLRPWSWDAEGSHVQAEVGWTVLEETTLAVLDHGLVKRIVPGRRSASSCSTAAPGARTTSRWRSRSPTTSASTTASCSRSGTSPSAGGA